MSESLDLQRIASDPAAFRDVLLIDAGDGPRRLGEVADDWQRNDFAALDPSWRQLAGRGGDGGKQRGYLERSRGHSKTTDQACMALWAVAFSVRQLAGIAAAADADQSKLLRDAVERMVRLNPWLVELVEVNNWAVQNRRTGSMLTIMSADAPSAYGQTPSFALVDEIVNWSSRAGLELWTAIFSACAKRDDCLLVVITNAGTGIDSSWQWKLRESIRTDPDWYFSRLDGSQASWISESKLAEQQRLLPPTAYARLWLNRWTTGEGDAFDEVEINAALADEIDPNEGPKSGWSYAAGLDLGLSRNAAVLVVTGRDSRTDRYRLAAIRSWIPKETGRVDFDGVEAAVVAEHRKWKWTQGNADPWQGVQMTDRLKKAGVPMALHFFTAPSQDTLARFILGLFRDGKLSLWNHPRLLPELRATLVVEQLNGKLKLVWPTDGASHGDHACAFCLSALAARTAVPRSTGFVIEVLGAGAFPVRASPINRIVAGYAPQLRPFFAPRDVFGKGQW